MSLKKFHFSMVSLWIWVFNIPIKSMNATVGNYIANEIGVPLLVDAPKSGLAWGPFLRIRVDVDISKPLMRGKMIQIEDMEKGWVYFKYERLPIYYYRLEFWDIKRGNVIKPRKDVFLQRRMTTNLGLGYELWVLRSIGEETLTVSQNRERPTMKYIRIPMWKKVTSSSPRLLVDCKFHCRSINCLEKSQQLLCWVTLLKFWVAK